MYCNFHIVIHCLSRYVGVDLHGIVGVDLFFSCDMYTCYCMWQDVNCVVLSVCVCSYVHACECVCTN